MSKLESCICRLCGDYSKKLVNLMKGDHSSEYVYQIQHYLNIKPEAFTEESRICHTCVDKLKNWDQFAQHVLNVHVYLMTSIYNDTSKLIPPLQGETVIRRTKRKFRKKVKEDETYQPPNKKKIKLKITQREEKSFVEYLDEPASSDKENNTSEDLSIEDSAVPQDKESESPIFAEDDIIDSGGEENQNFSEVDSRNSSSILDAKDPSWNCKECQNSFKSWSALARHSKDEHDMAPRVHCLCGKTLLSRGSVIKHHLKHTVGLQYKCDQCSKSYHLKRLLDVHLTSHLPKEEQPWLCCKCSRRFHSETLLKQHERMHLPPEQRLTFPCNTCKRKLCSKSALASHVRSVHLGERPFVCDQCGLSFTSKGILGEHLNVHSDLFNYHCTDCKKSFKSKNRLKLHMETHSQTLFGCPVCGLSLNTRRTLRMHLLVHKESKDYNCTTCGKAFKRSKDLKNHMNMHTGRKPYSCPFCTRTFANGSNCRSHKRRMHPIELKCYEEGIAADVVSDKTDEKPLVPMVPQNALTDSLIFKSDERVVKDEDELNAMILGNDDLASSLTLSVLSAFQCTSRISSGSVFTTTPYFSRQ